MTEYSGDDDKPKSPFTPGVVAILAIVLLALIGLNIILAALVVQARVGALVMLKSAAQAAPQRGTTDLPQETFPHPPGQMRIRGLLAPVSAPIFRGIIAGERESLLLGRPARR